jgi:HlyD family secretion protein
MTKGKLFLGAAVVAVAVLTVGRFALGPAAVTVEAPQHNVVLQVYGLGTVEARILSKIAFQVPGAIQTLRADVGDHVATGTVLAGLDAAEQVARLEQAKAAVHQAEAGLEQAHAGVVKAEAMQVKKAGVSRRRTSLVKEGWTSPEVAEDARTDDSAARADLTVAQSAVTVAEANLDAAKAALNREQVVLDQHVLRAPYDSIIIQRLKETGTVLSGNDPVFTVIDANTIWVLAYVEEARSGGLALGQPAEVRLRSRPGEMFPGRVARIDVESDRVSEERKVYVAFDHTPDDIHLAEQAEVLITTGNLPKVSMVPQAAVTDYKQGRGTVWAVEDGRLTPYRVRFGAASLDGRLPVLEGLPADAAIAATLPDHPEAGQRARMVTP